MQVLLLRPLAARVALVAVIGAAVTSAAWAQSGGTPATAASLWIFPGARARLVVSDYGEDLQTGTITAVRGDSFVFRRDKSGDSLTVGYTHVARLDVSRGRHARTLTGLVVGLVGGAAAVAALGAATYHTSPCSNPLLRCPSRGLPKAGPPRGVPWWVLWGALCWAPLSGP